MNSHCCSQQNSHFRNVLADGENFSTINGLLMLLICKAFFSCHNDEALCEEPSEDTLNVILNTVT